MTELCMLGRLGLVFAGLLFAMWLGGIEFHVH